MPLSCCSDLAMRHSPPARLFMTAGIAVGLRQEALSVLRSFSLPRGSNDNPFSEALFRTVKYRPDYPIRPFVSQERPASGPLQSWIVTPIGTTIAPSGTLHSSKATAARTWRPAVTALSSMNRRVSPTR